jgi:hypothetical protein
MPDLGSAKRNGCGGCSLSLFARYRADPTADCAGVLITRTDGDERDKKTLNLRTYFVRWCAPRFPQRSQIIDIVPKR